MAKRRAMKEETKIQTSREWLKSAAGKRAKKALKEKPAPKAKAVVQVKAALGKGPKPKKVGGGMVVKDQPPHGSRPGAPQSQLSVEQATKLAAQRGMKPMVNGSKLAPHGVVRARAGTGKTYTLVMGVANCYGNRSVVGGGSLWGKCIQTLRYVPEPSEQQQEVWDFIKQELPKRVLYAAFNNSIVKEFQEKWNWLVLLLQSIGVEFSFQTVHSLGWEACCNAYRYRNPFKAVDSGGYKTKDLLSVVWGKDLNEVWKEKRDVIDAIVELVSLCKLTLAGNADNAWDLGRGEAIVQPEDAELEELVVHYGIDVEDKKECFDATRKILAMAREQTERVMFDEQIWLPVVNNLPVTRFDLVLGDEAQDWNRCQQAILLKAADRMLLVGDERQAIYGWAGADVDSIPRMATSLLADQNRQVKEMRLTVTRRCGRAIVKEANRWVKDFEAHPKNAEGEVFRVGEEAAMASFGRDIDPRIDQPVLDEVVGKAGNCLPLRKGPDMVLCRVNAPLIKAAFQLLKEGRPFELRGGDMGKNMKWLIRKSGATDVSAFINWLDQYEATTMEKMKNRKWRDEDAEIVLQDKCECLRTFALGATTIKELYANIDQVFGDQKAGKQKWKKVNGRWQKDGEPQKVEKKPIVLSSIHRAKGLEAKRVFILRPDLLPHPKAKGDWQKLQEENLSYVAVTRAIDQLIYVDQKGGE